MNLNDIKEEPTFAKEVTVQVTEEDAAKDSKQ
jgi:hypothetical protein